MKILFSFIGLLILASCSIPAVGTSPLEPVLTSEVGEGWVKAGGTTYISIPFSEFDFRCKLKLNTDSQGTIYAERRTYDEDITSSFKINTFTAPESWKITLENVKGSCKESNLTGKVSTVFAVTLPQNETRDLVDVNIVIQTVRTEQVSDFNFKLRVEK